MRIIVLLFIAMVGLSAADAELKLAKDGTATITAKDSDLILYGYGKGLGLGTITVNGKPQKKPKVDPKSAPKEFAHLTFKGRLQHCAKYVPESRLITTTFFCSFPLLGKFVTHLFPLLVGPKTPGERTTE